LLWDTDTSLAMELYSPSGVEPVDNLFLLAFSPNGYTVIAVHNDGRILQWDIDLASWQKQACRRANRNLTREEWQHFFGDEPYWATCPELPVE
jgi:hypothetical protein